MAIGDDIRQRLTAQNSADSRADDIVPVRVADAEVALGVGLIDGEIIGTLGAVKVTGHRRTLTRPSKCQAEGANIHIEVAADIVDGSNAGDIVLEVVGEVEANTISPFLEKLVAGEASVGGDIDEVRVLAGLRSQCKYGVYVERS